MAACRHGATGESRTLSYRHLANARTLNTVRCLSEELIDVSSVVLTVCLIEKALSILHSITHADGCRRGKVFAGVFLSVCLSVFSARYIKTEATRITKLT